MKIGRIAKRGRKIGEKRVFGVVWFGGKLEEFWWHLGIFSPNLPKYFFSPIRRENSIDFAAAIPTTFLPLS